MPILLNLMLLKTIINFWIEAMIHLKVGFIFEKLGRALPNQTPTPTIHIHISILMTSYSMPNVCAFRGCDNLNFSQITQVFKHIQ